MPGINTFLHNVTLLVLEVILIIYLKHQPETPQNGPFRNCQSWSFITVHVQF